MKKGSILYLALFLAIVAAVAGGALAFANQVTTPVIAANAEKAEKASLSKMYPEASLEDFKAVENNPGEYPNIEKVYLYGDYVIFKCSVGGFDQGTTFLVSINPKDGVISNFKGISNGDTKGIGSKVLESAFADSLIGKEAKGQLDTISGATISSQPIIDEIHKCAEYAQQFN